MVQPYPPRLSWPERRFGARELPRWLRGALAAALVGAPAGANPAPEVWGLGPAAPGERRWFIQVDAPAGAAEGSPSRGAADQRVELIIGRSMTVDCNR
ncbi:MAG: hypothetical protein ACK59A_15630, partial [Cyanobacteriota bacterium]